MKNEGKHIKPLSNLNPPEGYFDEVEEVLLQKIRFNTKSTNKKTKIYTIGSWMSIAASIVFCVIYITKPKQEIELPLAKLNDINKDALEEYLIINKTPVAEIISTQNQDYNTNKSNDFTKDISKKEIEKYLEENNINYGL